MVWTTVTAGSGEGVTVAKDAGATSPAFGKTMAWAHAPKASGNAAAESLKSMGFPDPVCAF
jgi:hypothetical protein